MKQTFIVPEIKIRIIVVKMQQDIRLPQCVHKVCTLINTRQALLRVQDFLKIIYQ